MKCTVANIKLWNKCHCAFPILFRWTVSKKDGLDISVYLTCTHFFCRSHSRIDSLKYFFSKTLKCRRNVTSSSIFTKIKTNTEGCLLYCGTKFQLISSGYSQATTLNCEFFFVIFLSLLLEKFDYSYMKIQQWLFYENETFFVRKQHNWVTCLFRSESYLCKSPGFLSSRAPSSRYSNHSQPLDCTS